MAAGGIGDVLGNNAVNNNSNILWQSNVPQWRRLRSADNSDALTKNSFLSCFCTLFRSSRIKFVHVCICSIRIVENINAQNVTNTI